MNIPFYKYHGTGNDFILIDNRSQQYDLVKSKDIVAKWCHRRFGIGADGLMLLEKNSNADFDMIYYNADGNLGSFCGNGGRCIVAFANHLGLVNEQVVFNAADGQHHATIKSRDYIELEMNPVNTIELHQDHAILNTGSPHYVLKVTELASYPVFESGKSIRYSPAFPNGINVNFVEKKGDQFHIRTYERGVEDETWACGTGATAAAIALVELDRLYDINELNLQAIGGPLTVQFNRVGPGQFNSIRLCGNAIFVYTGHLQLT